MTPIATAVEVLKAPAVEAAREKARSILAAMKKQFEENGWDLNRVAPRPTIRDSRADYKSKTARRTRFEMVTLSHPDSPASYRSSDEPRLRVWSPEAADKFVEDAARDAAIEFDKYVYKLQKKVGDVVDAKVTLCSGLWYQSILSVTKADNTAQNWKTQCIINVSKLGLVFNQWPTRLMK